MGEMQLTWEEKTPKASQRLKSATGGVPSNLVRGGSNILFSRESSIILGEGRLTPRCRGTRIRSPTW